jgi:hypothetical protein
MPAPIRHGAVVPAQLEGAPCAQYHQDNRVTLDRRDCLLCIRIDLSCPHATRGMLDVA